MKGLIPLQTTPISDLYFIVGEFKRGEASLKKPSPLPLIKGKGDKGGWGYLIKNLKEVS